MFMIMTPPVL